MQADPWWSLAMAINVFLVFFYGAIPSSFRHYVWLYCLVCFGGPFIPAIVLLLARPNGRLMYGNATVSVSRITTAWDPTNFPLALVLD